MTLAEIIDSDEDIDWDDDSIGLMQASTKTEGGSNRRREEFKNTCLIDSMNGLGCNLEYARDGPLSIQYCIATKEIYSHQEIWRTTNSRIYKAERKTRRGSSRDYLAVATYTFDPRATVAKISFTFCIQ